MISPLQACCVHTVEEKKAGTVNGPLRFDEGFLSINGYCSISKFFEYKTLASLYPEADDSDTRNEK